MKNKYYLIILLVFIMILSCIKEKETPKVIYEESKNNIEAPKKDTSEIEVVDLPIVIEGMDYLLHPVGNIRITNASSSYGSSKIEGMSYSIANYSENQITGYLNNIFFQHKDSTALYPLTKEIIQIQHITFIKPNASLKTNKKYLLYTITDKDTNKDGKVNENDIRTLYLSDQNGKNLKKLSSDFQEFLDFNYVELQNKIYFRCIEDINKNGAFDKNDLVHYHFINLNNKDILVEEYKPI